MSLTAHITCHEPHDNFDCELNKLTGREPKFPHALQPFPAGPITLAVDQTDQAGAYGFDTAEFQNIALKASQTVRKEKPAIDECGHSHSDDDPGRPAL